MKSNKSIMKAIHPLLILFVIVFINELQGQNKNNDTIFWDNGNISLLSDLGRIHIVKKKGANITEARIYEIKKEKGVLVYEKDKCLHDISISNIENIQPGYNPLAILLFKEDNTPYIKELYKKTDSYNEPTNFKIAAVKQIITPKARVIPTQQQKSLIDSSSTLQHDVLIDLEGNEWPIKILIVQENILEFKKTSNLDGPIYVKTFTHAEFTKRDNHTIIKIIK
ncbi:MAG TPA: hypothetical protein PLC65_04165 [Bacteroidia bacterium]|nr:hypothetical protein [Bacteroidia bacterium]HRD37804.1 hypothetical protein [Bacteroidia bacterium]